MLCRLARYYDFKFIIYNKNKILNKILIKKFKIINTHSY